MQSKFKRAWSVISTVLVVLVVVLAVLIVGGRLIGVKTYTVLSGSMEPEYHVGSLILVWTKGDHTELEVDEPVTFWMNESTVATHRIIEVIPDENDPEVVRYRTKGDANDDPDGSLLHCKNVIGTPFFTIPLLGYVVVGIQNLLSNPLVRFGLLGVCGIALIVILVLNWNSAKKKENEGGDVVTEQTEEDSYKGVSDDASEEGSDPKVAEVHATEEGADPDTAKAEAVEDCSNKSKEE